MPQKYRVEFFGKCSLVCLRVLILLCVIAPVLVDYGKLDSDSLLAKSQVEAGQRLQLRLRSGARRGQPEVMDQVWR